MAQGTDLTTLARVKAWLGIDNTKDDVLLARLITAASRFILAYLCRHYLFKQTVTEYIDGHGNASFPLKNWPVASVSSLTVDGVTIAAVSAQPFTNGFFVDPAQAAPPGLQQFISLFGYTANKGLANVVATYVAGYFRTEAFTIPATPFKVTVAQPYGIIAVDEGVTYASTGTALVAVTGTPSAGQYAVDIATGEYTFAAADEGAAVNISYSFIPADIENACIEIVGERYKVKDRIGQTSKSIGGQETVAFATKDMGDAARAMLNPYRDVMP